MFHIFISHFLQFTFFLFREKGKTHFFGEEIALKKLSTHSPSTQLQSNQFVTKQYRMPKTQLTQTDGPRSIFGTPFYPSFEICEDNIQRSMQSIFFFFSETEKNISNIHKRKRGTLQRIISKQSFLMSRYFSKRSK